MKTKKGIARCTILWRPACPRDWDALVDTGVPDVRRCGACGDDVHFVRTDEETIRHAELGHCVAREWPDPSELPQWLLVIGRVEVEQPEPTPEQRRAEAWARRESGIANAILPSSMLSGRRCGACGYPTPTFIRNCYVCGAETPA